MEKTHTIQESTPPLPPDLLCEIKEMRSDMVLLKDLKAEISQIMKTIQKTTSPQYPPPSTEPQQPPAPCPMFSSSQSPPYRAESNVMP